MILRFRLPGVEVIPKPGFSRRAAETSRYHDQQADIVAAFTVQALTQRPKPRYPVKGVVLSFVAEYADRKTRDWSNVAKALEDALVKAGILEDDNARVLPGADRCRVRLASRHPGVVLELREDDGPGLDYQQGEGP